MWRHPKRVELQGQHFDLTAAPSHVPPTATPQDEHVDVGLLKEQVRQTLAEAGIVLADDFDLQLTTAQGQVLRLGSDGHVDLDELLRTAGDASVDFVVETELKVVPKPHRPLERMRAYWDGISLHHHSQRHPHEDPQHHKESLHLTPKQKRQELHLTFQACFLLMGLFMFRLGSGTVLNAIPFIVASLGVDVTMALWLTSALVCAYYLGAGTGGLLTGRSPAWLPQQRLVYVVMLCFIVLVYAGHTAALFALEGSTNVPVVVSTLATFYFITGLLNPNVAVSMAALSLLDDAAPPLLHRKRTKDDEDAEVQQRALLPPPTVVVSLSSSSSSSPPLLGTVDVATIMPAEMRHHLRSRILMLRPLISTIGSLVGSGLSAILGVVSASYLFLIVGALYAVIAAATAYSLRGTFGENLVEKRERHVATLAALSAASPENTSRPDTPAMPDPSTPPGRKLERGLQASKSAPALVTSGHKEDAHEELQDDPKTANGTDRPTSSSPAPSPPPPASVSPSPVTSSATKAPLGAEVVGARGGTLRQLFWSHVWIRACTHVFVANMLSMIYSSTVRTVQVYTLGMTPAQSAIQMIVGSLASLGLSYGFLSYVYARIPGALSLCGSDLLMMAILIAMPWASQLLPTSALAYVAFCAIADLVDGVAVINGATYATDHVAKSEGFAYGFLDCVNKYVCACAPFVYTGLETALGDAVYYVLAAMVAMLLVHEGIDYAHERYIVHLLFKLDAALHAKRSSGDYSPSTSRPASTEPLSAISSASGTLERLQSTLLRYLRPMHFRRHKTPSSSHARRSVVPHGGRLGETASPHASTASLFRHPQRLFMAILRGSDEAHTDHHPLHHHRRTRSDEGATAATAAAAPDSLAPLPPSQPGKLPQPTVGLVSRRGNVYARINGRLHRRDMANLPRDRLAFERHLRNMMLMEASSNATMMVRFLDDKKTGRKPFAKVPS